jgi:predicted ATPase
MMDKVSEFNLGIHAPMIRRIYIDNYKCLVNFELKLQELTLLTGSNGAGKTCVLEVILALRQLLTESAKLPDKRGGRHVVFKPSTLNRWRKNYTQTIELDVELGEITFGYRLVVEHDLVGRQAIIGEESLTINSKSKYSTIRHGIDGYRDDLSAFKSSGNENFSESGLAKMYGNESLEEAIFFDFVRKIIVCAFNPINLASESSEEDAMLARDGHNFASWYRHLILERHELIDEFTQALKPVIPGFRTIRMEKVGLDTRALMVLFDDFEHKFEMRLDELSDGQRVLIALYAMLKLTAGQGYTLFLDEPENFVALAEIQPWLMELYDACGDTIPQAVLCSHHPELIDYLGPDAGIEFERTPDGLTDVKRMRDLVPYDSVLKLSEIVARGWQS